TDRQPIAVSPDGRYIAVCARDPEEKEGRNGRRYTSKGVTFEAQGMLMRIMGPENESRELFPKSTRSWAPVWSPDGTKLAFFSDSDGYARVWVWSPATNELKKVPEVVARPY